MSVSVEVLDETPLHDWHAAHGGRMVGFGGWAMPVQYATITDEHRAIRSGVGLFDISHMGRLRFSGPDALGWLDYATTNSVSKLVPGQIQYSLMVDASGGVLDDILVYCLQEPGTFGVVCNASNRPKVVAQFEQVKNDRNAKLADLTLESTMIAVQGPKAAQVVARVVEGADVAGLGYYRHVDGMVLGEPTSISRTGYTGEDGFELIVPNRLAVPLWEKLLEVGQDFGIRPCGLGARDTLRFEAAMPLYGHEMDESVNPYAAGLGWAVKLQKGDFVGRDALRAFKKDPLKARVGLEMSGKRIARQGCPVLRNGQAVGVVTSGTFAPTLGKALAMALVDLSANGEGTILDVDVRGQHESARVVPLPFYRRPVIG